MLNLSTFFPFKASDSFSFPLSWIPISSYCSLNLSIEHKTREEYDLDLIDG